MTATQQTRPAGNTQRDPLKILIAWLSVIADLGAVSAIVALWIRKDFNLIFVIAVISLGSVVLLTRLIQSGWVDRQHLAVLFTFLLISITFVVTGWLWLTNRPVQPIQIEIIKPKTATVAEGYRALVQGHVSDPHANVRVLVHPLVVAEMWVQDSPVVDSAGNWQVNAYFGEPGKGIGENFEIIALATNENFLVTWVTGNALPLGQIDSASIPRNTNPSNTVTITRTR
jgi:hypothetical protein